jgi:hypothetical protein
MDFVCIGNVIWDDSSGHNDQKKKDKRINIELSNTNPTNTRVNSGALKGYAVLAQLVVPVVLFLL